MKPTLLIDVFTLPLETTIKELFTVVLETPFPKAAPILFTTETEVEFPILRTEVAAAATYTSTLEVMVKTPEVEMLPPLRESWAIKVLDINVPNSLPVLEVMELPVSAPVALAVRTSFVVSQAKAFCLMIKDSKVSVKMFTLLIAYATKFLQQRFNRARQLKNTSF